MLINLNVPSTNEATQDLMNIDLEDTEVNTAEEPLDDPWSTADSREEIGMVLLEILLEDTTSGRVQPLGPKETMTTVLSKVMAALLEMDLEETEGEPSPLENIHMYELGYQHWPPVRAVSELMGQKGTSTTAVTPGIRTSTQTVLCGGLVDGEQFVYYDSNTTRRMIPRTWWMERNEDGDYWNSETQISQGHEESFKINVATAKERFNQTTGVHTVQWMYGCELGDDGTKRGHMQHGYDGEDFLSLDLNAETWTAANPKAVITKQKWERESWGGQVKTYLENTCTEWLQKYVGYGRSTLERRVRPEVSLFQKDSSSPVVCHATGFFPKAVMISWKKNGEDLYEDVELRETLPNQDGTFQKRSILTVPPEELDKHTYTCVIFHSSLEKEMMLQVSDRRVLSDLVNQYPKTQYPGTRYPGTQYPGTQYPGTRYPGTRYPGTRYPGIRYPETQYPETRYPGTQYPGTHYPGTRYPGTRYPGIRYPETQYPETRYPGTRYPGTRYPGIRYPGTRYPGTRYPGIRYPGTRYPETRYPETRYPETRYPGTRYHTKTAFYELTRLENTNPNVLTVYGDTRKTPSHSPNSLRNPRVPHSLQYFYTAVTPGINFPEFTVVGLVDGQQVVYYDSNTRKMIPKTEWMERNEGVHAVQWMYGCELDDDGTRREYDQYGYGGEDFLSLDLNTETWTAANAKAVITKQKWEREAWAAQVKNYLRNTCIEWLRKYVGYGRATLERRVPPEVDLFQKDSSSPVVCHATGFYPKPVMISWKKNGEDLDEDVELTETVPNQDGTFQKKSILIVSPEELDRNNYTCIIQHSSLEKEVVLQVSDRRVVQ
ncbi:hypothetical protein NFI96_011368, partial [Prochilodus magdalenae]